MGVKLKEYARTLKREYARTYLFPTDWWHNLKDLLPLFGTTRV